MSKRHDQRLRFGATVVLLGIGLTTLIVGCSGPTFVGGGPVSTFGDETVRASFDPVADRVTLVSTASGRADVATGFIPSKRLPAVHFSGFDWAATGRSETYVYGLAPHGAVQVNLLSTVRSLLVSAPVAGDGTFVVVLHGDADALPNSFGWRFLDASQRVIAEGIGATS